MIRGVLIMQKIQVVVTMDCEPTTETTHPTATGPDTWALGERAVRGYAEIANEYNFPVTFFIHPEAAVAQTSMFDELRRHGACLGLHVHAWKYSLWRHQGKKYMDHYGGLSEQEQWAILGETSALWQQALGEKPLYFRPGTFSANDAIFKVLTGMGFKGGSCSVPGRQMPEMRAVWQGAEPDPHRGHATFRMLAGDLNFVNMPLSTDFSLSLKGRKGRKLHPDLRPDIDWLAQYNLTYDEIAENIVTQIIQRAPTVPVINLVSHNHFDYCDPKDPAFQRFHDSLKALKKACNAKGLKPVGATIADVTDTLLAKPVTKSELVLEGNVVDKA